MEEHPFQPGTEVAKVYRGGWNQSVSYEIVKIAKVHRTGRFTIEGSNQQFRARKEHSGQWTGWSTGAGGYSTRLELVTDRLIEEAEATKRRDRFKNIVYALDKETRKLAERVTDAHLADLERIYAELSKEPEQ